MRHRCLNSAWRRKLIAGAIATAFLLSGSARAADLDLDRFRTEINEFIERLGAVSNGLVTWAGSDPLEVERDGQGPVAIIENARVAFNAPQPGQLTLDHIEIRETGRKEEGKLIELGFALPKVMTFSEADGRQTRIALKAATATVIVDAVSGRGRETAIEIAGARIDRPDGGSWVSLGPLSAASKLAVEPNGGWVGSVEFEVRGLEFFCRGRR
jgi:hypothetical protein